MAQEEERRKKKSVRADGERLLRRGLCKKPNRFEQKFFARIY